MGDQAPVRLKGHAADGACSLAAAAGGAVLCSGCTTDATVRLWGRRCMRPQLVLEGHGGAVTALVAASGRWLVGSGPQYVLWVWDVSSGRCEGVLEGLRGHVRSLGARHSVAPFLVRLPLARTKRFVRGAGCWASVSGGGRRSWASGTRCRWAAAGTGAGGGAAAVSPSGGEPMGALASVASGAGGGD